MLLPGWWSIALAGPLARWRDLATMLWLLGLFWVGAVLMRGAGCTVNDIFDRNIDAAVERTRGRPLPSGQVTVLEAIVFMLLLTALAAFVLLSLTPLAVVLGLGVLTLVGTYPLMKRITWWPQFFLGLNFNWGALLGWAAATGRVEAPAAALYLAGIAWTLGYDTIYAHQDKADDAAVGVKSTALLLGRASRVAVAGFYALAVLGVLLAFESAHAGHLAYLALPFLAAHFLWQVAFWRPDYPADCLLRFQSNRNAGLIVFAGCLAAHL